MSNPPTSSTIAASFDKILGRQLSGHLGDLFERVSASLSAMIQDSYFPQIQEYINRFLFEYGFQEIGVRISEDATKVLIRHDSKKSLVNFPDVKNPGDLDAIAQFFPIKIETAQKSQTAVNEFDAFIGMCGMPPIQTIVAKLRDLIICGADGGNATQFPIAMAKNLLEAIKITLPNGHKFASDLIDMSSVHLDFEPCPQGGIFVELTGEMNMTSLEQLYPSMASLLKHLGNMDISVIDMHDKTKQTAEIDAATAKCLLRIRITYERGAIELHINMMLPSDGSNSLLWFDRSTRTCILDGIIPMKADFLEHETNYLKYFRVVIDGAMRIPQLGCGSIGLPLIIVELKCSSSKNTFQNSYHEDCPVSFVLKFSKTELTLKQAHRFDITILHMTEKRLTQLLLRPFFNLDLLRFILLNHFHVQMQISPPSKALPISTLTKESEFHQDESNGFETYYDTIEEASSASQKGKEVQVHEEVLISHPTRHRREDDLEGLSEFWVFTSKLHMFLPPPPRIILSCLNLFVGEQMASPDNIRMMVDMLTSFSKDLKQMNARLARIEGDELAAKQVEAEIVEESEFHRRSIRATEEILKNQKKTSKKRRCSIM